MPTPTVYTKSISSDFPNGKVSVDSLEKEISESSIVVSLDYINIIGDACQIWFKDILSVDDQSELTTVVATHQGIRTDMIGYVKIEEESTKTGGNFASETTKITASPGQTGVKDMFWPHPISALSMRYVTTDTQEGDTINLKIAPDLAIGGLTADIPSGSLPSAWVLKNYIVGEAVTYPCVVNGNRVLTCIKNTVNNEAPANREYWRPGFKIRVSSTVIAITQLGYYLTLADGTNTDDLGRVLHKTVDSVFVEKAPMNEYLASTPTVVKQTIWLLNGYEFGPGWSYLIGDSKIGGSYVPADTLVRLEYTNNGILGDRTLVGALEYLY